MQERFDFDRCKNATLTAATTDALLRAAMQGVEFASAVDKTRMNNQLAFVRHLAEIPKRLSGRISYVSLRKI